MEGERERESYYERLAAYKGVGITSVPNTDESKMHLPGCRKQKHLKRRERAAQAVRAGGLQSRDVRGYRGHQEGPEQAFPQHNLPVFLTVCVWGKRGRGGGEVNSPSPLTQL